MTDDNQTPNEGQSTVTHLKGSESGGAGHPSEQSESERPPETLKKQPILHGLGQASSTTLQPTPPTEDPQGSTHIPSKNFGGIASFEESNQPQSTQEKQEQGQPISGGLSESGTESDPDHLSGYALNSTSTPSDSERQYSQGSGTEQSGDDSGNADAPGTSTIHSKGQGKGPRKAINPDYDDSADSLPKMTPRLRRIEKLREMRRKAADRPVYKTVNRVKRKRGRPTAEQTKEAQGEIKPLNRQERTLFLAAKALQGKIIGLSNKQTAACVGVHPNTIQQALEKYRPFFKELDEIKEFSLIKLDIFDAIEAQLLKSVTSKVSEATLRDVAYTFKEIFTANRLSRDLSTANTKQQSVSFTAPLPDKPKSDN